MELRPIPGVRRIIVLRPGESGALAPTTIYREKRKRRKGSAPVRPVERMVRRLGKSQKAMVDAYLDRHDRSNRKKRDGWLRDCADNVYKASSKGLRKLI